MGRTAGRRIDEIEGGVRRLRGLLYLPVYIQGGSTADRRAAVGAGKMRSWNSSDARTPQSRLSCQIPVNESLDGSESRSPRRCKLQLRSQATVDNKLGGR